MARPLHDIASEIRRNWLEPNFAAKPYIDAMSQLNSMKDSYGCDPARTIVTYFLSNASRWRGDTARRVKTELKAMAGI